MFIFHTTNNFALKMEHYKAVFMQHPGTVEGNISDTVKNRLYLTEESLALSCMMQSTADAWGDLGEESVYTEDGEHYISLTATSAITLNSIVWSNFDILYRTANEDAGIAVGDIYLAASDPVPVGGVAPDIDPAAFMEGLRIGQIVRAMRL